MLLEFFVLCCLKHADKHQHLAPNGVFMCIPYFQQQISNKPWPLYFWPLFETHISHFHSMFILHWGTCSIQHSYQTNIHTFHHSKSCFGESFAQCKYVLALISDKRSRADGRTEENTIKAKNESCHAILNFKIFKFRVFDLSSPLEMCHVLKLILNLWGASWRSCKLKLLLSLLHVQEA